MTIYKKGHDMYGGYGDCWIEGDGVWFWVYTMDGKSKIGPFSSLEDAKREFARWCAS